MPQSKKLHPEIDDDDDFELPISTFRVDKTNKKRPVDRCRGDDDGLGNPVPKKSKIQKNKPSKKVDKGRKQSHPEQPRDFFEYHNETLLLRCQPTPYMETIREFSGEQVADVKNMGFGSVLDVQLNHISTHLGFWLVRNFDEQYDELNVGNHRIKITSNTVHKVFGIPKSSKPVVTIIDKRKLKKSEKNKKDLEPEGGNSVLEQFSKQWYANDRITHGSIATAISSQKEGGSLFKINFLVYWVTIFVEITKATTANDKCLLGVETVEDIPRLDWCSYVLECLRRTRMGWKNPNIQYVGPVAFLSLLYAHEYNKRHRLFKKVVELPVIRYITSAMIDELEEIICDKGPLTDDEEGDRNELDCSTDEYTIRPVDPSYRHGSGRKIEDTNSDDMLDTTIHMLETSQLDLEFGVGTQTQQMMDYCNTPIQLSPCIIYSPEQEQEREASRNNKQNLLKFMKGNIEKYQQIVEEMNKLVPDVKTKCFWDPDIMKVCTEWENKLRQNAVYDADPMCEPAVVPEYEAIVEPTPVCQHDAATVVDAACINIGEIAQRGGW